jgi:CHAT domain-containing protein/Flp pilus assembly protein TadD
LLLVLAPGILPAGPLTLVAAQQAAQEETERLSNQVLTLFQQGRYEEAIPLAQRALETGVRSLGKEHPVVAGCLVNLGALYRHTGRHDKVEPIYLLAAEIYRKSLNAENAANKAGLFIAYARLLNNLASLYVDTGRFGEAEPRLLLAAGIYEKALGSAHSGDATILSSYALTLHNLAELYRRARRYDKAEPLFLRAAELRKRSLGPQHPAYAESLDGLAVLYLETRRYNEAEPLLLHAAEIRKTISDGKHPNYATSLNNLASYYKNTGRYDQAERLYLESAEIISKALGPEHPYYATCLANLASVYQMTGRSREAFSLLTQAMEIEQANLQRIFAVSSEAAMRAYLLTVRGALSGLMSIAASGPKISAETVETALNWALRRKAIILDTLIRFRQAQRLAHSDREVAARAERLRYLRQQLSSFPLSRPPLMSDLEFQRQIRRWRAESDQIESDLNRRLAARQQEQFTDAVVIPAVRKRLPAGSALIEFVRSDIRDFKATNQQPLWKPARYFAFVLTGDPALPPRMVDLGEAAPIEEAVKAVRSSITEFGEKWRVDRGRLLNEAEQEKDLQRVSKKLYDLIFAPVRKELGAAIKMVYLAPDDQLNLVPFGALVDAGGKYLIENYRFVYLSTGRDLLHAQGKATGQGTVVFADPDYDLATAARAQKARELLAETAKRPGDLAGDTQTGGSPYRSTLLPDKVAGQMRQSRGGLRWDPLPASAAEASAVSQLLNGTDYGQVKQYLRGEALEEVFKQVRSPRILHIATHGFFPAERSEIGAEERPIDLGSGNAAVVGISLLERTGNPLLQSGLVLAGANTLGEKQAQQVDDGWVTAEEIGLMELQGTELVVLSACGSGLGAVSAGEGVYGLRRAFQQAGAQTIISTLFEVPDKEAGQIMRSFYEGLKNRKGKLEALHEAQLQMIEDRRKEDGAAHPFFWASFVLTGDPH